MFDSIYRAGSAAASLNKTEGASRKADLSDLGITALAGGVTAAGLGAYQGYAKSMPQLLGLDLDGVLGFLGVGAKAAMIATGHASSGWKAHVASLVGGVGLGGGFHWAAVQGNIYGVNKAAQSAGDVGTGVDYGRAGARELPQDRTVRHEPPRHAPPAQVQFGSMHGMF